MFDLNPHRRSRHRAAATVLAMFAFAMSTAPMTNAIAANPAPAIQTQDVHVERSGDTFTVDLVLHVAVPPARAWAVLTDFEHQKDFVPNVTTSDVSERRGNQLKLTQKGTAHYGIFSRDFESVREVQMTPQNEIRSHGVGGNVEHVESVLRLEAEAAGTRITYHTEVQIGFWLPPIFGTAAVQQQTADQFNAIIQEMLKQP